jgi:hypothetical protein
MGCSEAGDHHLWWKGGGRGKQRRERREDSRSGRLEGRRRIEA